MLDLRLPSGLFFAITGLILVVMGLAFPEIRATLTDTNLNLWAGLAMLVFGTFLLVLARRDAGRKNLA